MLTITIGVVFIERSNNDSLFVRTWCTRTCKTNQPSDTDNVLVDKIVDLVTTVQMGDVPQFNGGTLFHGHLERLGNHVPLCSRSTTSPDMLWTGTES